MSSEVSKFILAGEGLGSAWMELIVGVGLFFTLVVVMESMMDISWLSAATISGSEVDMTWLSAAPIGGTSIDPVVWPTERLDGGQVVEVGSVVGTRCTVAEVFWHRPLVMGQQSTNL